MHSFISTIFSGFSSRIINAYANLNTSNSNPQHQPNEQNSCQHAEPRGNDHLNGPGLWQMWAGATKISYCHHERPGSAGSTEYWVWNGPEDHKEVSLPLLQSFCPSNKLCTIDIERVSYAYSRLLTDFLVERVPRTRVIIIWREN